MVVTLIASLALCTHRSRRRLPREALEEEFLEAGVGTSPLLDGLKPSLAGMDWAPGPGPEGAGSWITMMSSLLCWPRCSLAKSKPLTLGACSCRK